VDDVKGEVIYSAFIFISSFTVHAALLLLRHYSFLGVTQLKSLAVQQSIDLIAVVLQAISLWALLNCVIIYAFDEIDYGQKKLLANMTYGKRLFVKEVKKFSLIVSGCVATMSCGFGGFGLSAGNMARRFCLLSSGIMPSTFSHWGEIPLRKLLPSLNISDDNMDALENAFSTSMDAVTTICRHARATLSWAILKLPLAMPGPLKKIGTSSTAGFTEVVFRVSSTRSRVCESRAVVSEQWMSRALDISSFITLRLGVFVLALALMGHILLPKPEEKVNKKLKEIDRGPTRTEINSEHSSVASSLNLSRHSVSAYGNLSSMEVITE